MVGVPGPESKVRGWMKRDELWGFDDGQGRRMRVELLADLD